MTSDKAEQINGSFAQVSACAAASDRQETAYDPRAGKTRQTDGFGNLFLTVIAK